MDVMTAYLYRSLDSDIYMEVPNGISVPNMHANHNMYCVKLVKSLYGLKQSERMPYNRLKEFLLKKVTLIVMIAPCVFIRKSTTGFCIISIYVDHLNIIGHTKYIDEAHNYLKMEFEMKNLGRTKFWLGLHIEHLHTGILIYQFAYVQKILEKFNMDKAYSARTRMVVCALKKVKDPFRLKEGEEVLRQEYSYLSFIGALIYLTNNIKPNIVFAVNYLVRHNTTPIIRHWNNMKNIL
jgi:hypothetical protein